MEFKPDENGKQQLNHILLLKLLKPQLKIKQFLFFLTATKKAVISAIV